jgi:hypothetical protein
MLTKIDVHVKRLLRHDAVGKADAQWRSQGWHIRNVVGRVPKIGLQWSDWLAAGFRRKPLTRGEFLARFPRVFGILGGRAENRCNAGD